MVDSLGTLAYELIMELLVASALIWATVALAVRFLRITDPVWRMRFFLLPVLLPVLAVPLIHLVVRPLLPALSTTYLEGILTLVVRFSPVVPAAFLVIAALLLCLGFAHAFRPLAAAGLLNACWRRQRQLSSPLWLRCNARLESLVSRLRLSPVRLVLTEDNSCGSIAPAPLGSYVAVPKVLASVLDDEEFEALLAHELGHIIRGDTLLGVTVGICRRLMIFSPFAQSACRRFRQAREEAVDDLAARTTSRPLALASCLVKAYRFSQGEARRVPVTCLLPSMDAVTGRIQRLLEKDCAAVAEPPRWYGWAFSALIASVVALSLLTV